MQDENQPEPARKSGPVDDHSIPAAQPSAHPPADNEGGRWGVAGRILTSGPVAAVILVIAYCLALTGVAHKSPTFDELRHLTGGYGIWLRHDFRVFPDNGNLPQRWGGLPSLWRHDRFPAIDDDDWRTSNIYPLCDQFFYSLGNDADGMLFSARAVMALLIFPLGVLIYFWSRSLFGAAAANVSTLLFAFCPSMLGHAPLVASDVMVTLFFFLATGSFWRLFHRINILNVLFAGLAGAGVLLAKASGVLIAPMVLLLLLIRLQNPEPLPVGRPGMKLVWGAFPKLGIFTVVLFVELFIMWACLWAAFDFRFSAFADDGSLKQLFPGGWEHVVQQPGLTAQVAVALRDHHILPESWLFGIGMVADAARARVSFLNGALSLTGFKTFFPFAFSVKETIPFLILLGLAAAAFATVWQRAGKPGSPERANYFCKRLYATSPLWVIIVVYGLFALTSHLNIGHRHLFPIYPALFVLAGAAATWFSRRTLFLGVLVSALLAWHVAESFAVWPNYLTYFNEMAGGPQNGYRHLVDSSLDWGQDLPGLKDWLARHQLDNDQTPVYLLYFGTARPEYYQIHATQLPGVMDRTPLGMAAMQPLQPGYYCISASLFEGVYLHFPGPWTDNYEQVFQSQAALVDNLLADDGRGGAPKDMSQNDLQSLLDQFPRLRVARLCAWLRAQNAKPVALIGNTIFIFQLNADDLRAALTQKIDN